MNAKDFYKYKTKHDLRLDYGVRLTGEELFNLMEQFASQKPDREELKDAFSAGENYKASKLGIGSEDDEAPINAPDFNEWVDEYLKQQPSERYFSDPHGEGWPELEDDCAPD